MKPQPLIPNARRAVAEDTVAGLSAGVYVVALADDGPIAPVLFWPRGDQVELWHSAGCAGSLHRRVLFHWLTRPTQDIGLSNDTVRLTFTPSSGIVLSLPGLTEWPIARIKVAELRHRQRP